jgi:hypothetical protein
MFDPVILLTPLLVLVIALLLGFAGCGARLESAPQLQFMVRVPGALTVTRLQLYWTDPEGDMGGLDQPNPYFTVDEVFSYVLTPPAQGGWSVYCGLTVRDSAGTTSQDGVTCDFVLMDETKAYKYTFEGSVSDLTFVVTCKGLT